MQLRIDNMASDGKGIARTDTGVVFVPGALPGELVEAETVLRKREYSVARIIEIHEPNEQRTQPKCPYFGNCGGCQLQHAEYSLQLDIKSSFVEDAMTRIGKFERTKITCIPSPKIWNYRNKASFPVKRGPTMGFYVAGSHKLVKIQSCMIIDEILNSAFDKIQAALPTIGIEPYDEVHHKGQLRHVMLRTNGEKLLASFILNGKLVKRKEILKIAEGFLDSTFTVNFNDQKGNAIIGERTEILSGDGLINANVGGYQVSYDSTSFFQVNSPQAENIYSYAASLIDSNGHLLELYSGVGSMTLQLAKRAEKVTAVEEWKPAVELMKRNLELNRLSNVVPICAKSEEFMSNGAFSAVVLDPPRSGCDEKVIGQIAALKIPQVVYVSCNPATLARDLSRLRSLGYKLNSIQAFDMFPQTTHVETCVLLSHKDK